MLWQEVIGHRSHIYQSAKIGIKFHNTVLQVPFSVSLFFRVVGKKNPTNNKLLRAMWRRVTRMLGMNEDTHRVLARDYLVTADW